MLATNSRNRYRTQAGTAGGVISVLADHCRAAILRGDAESAREMAEILVREARKTGLYWPGPDSDPCALCGHTYEGTSVPASWTRTGRPGPISPTKARPHCRATAGRVTPCPCPAYVSPSACEHCGCMAERHRDGSGSACIAPRATSTRRWATRRRRDGGHDHDRDRAHPPRAVPRGGGPHHAVLRRGRRTAEVEEQLAREDIRRAASRGLVDGL